MSAWTAMGGDGRVAARVTRLSQIEVVAVAAAAAVSAVAWRAEDLMKKRHPEKKSCKWGVDQDTEEHRRIISRGLLSDFVDKIQSR